MRRERKTDPSPKPVREKNAFLVVSIEVAIGLLLSILSFIFFINITERVLASSGNFDTALSQFIYSIRTPTLTAIMTVITAFGDVIVLGIITLIFIVLNWKTHKREAIIFTVVLVMTFIINVALKELIARPRPSIDPLFDMRTYSFPSGHAMSAFVFYALMARFIFYFTNKSELGFILAFCSIIMIFFVGLSRVYLGVHYTSDVVAGFVGGFWIVMTAILIERTLIFYRLFRERRGRTKK
jgi:membrane-associated phospholipid phosphatase